MARILLTVVLLIAASFVHAHEDRELLLQRDGSILGIPARFGTAFLSVGLDSATPRIKLHIGSSSTSVPSCIARLVRSKSLSGVRISGSWYHDESVLPYYLNITFYAPGSSRDQATGDYTSILFNLHNAQIIDVIDSTSGWLWFKGSYKRYAVRDLCGASGMRPNNSFKPTPLRGAA